MYHRAVFHHNVDDKCKLGSHSYISNFVNKNLASPNLDQCLALFILHLCCHVVEQDSSNDNGSAQTRQECYFIAKQEDGAPDQSSSLPCVGHTVCH